MEGPKVILVLSEPGGCRAVGFADLDDAARLTNSMVNGLPQPTIKRALQSLAFTLGQHEERGEYSGEDES